MDNWGITKHDEAWDYIIPKVIEREQLGLASAVLINGKKLSRLKISAEKKRFRFNNHHRKLASRKSVLQKHTCILIPCYIEDDEGIKRIPTPPGIVVRSPTPTYPENLIRSPASSSLAIEGQGRGYEGNLPNSSDPLAQEFYNHEEPTMTTGESDARPLAENDEGYISVPPTVSDDQSANVLTVLDERHNYEHSLREVSGSKAEASDIPDDSGFASQSRRDNAHAELIAFLRHYEDRQLAVNDGEEEMEDDIESILSDTADIQSNISVDTNLPAQEGNLHLAQMLTTDPDLAPLFRIVLGRMERGRFINTIRKLLKPYYRNLLQEVSNERQRASVQLLKSRRGRHRIGIAILKFLDSNVDKEDSGKEDSEKRDEFLEQIQRRAEFLNTWISQLPHVDGLEDQVDFDDGLSDEDGDCSSTESDGPDFPQLVEMEKFFRESKSFGLLLGEFRKLLLPRELRHVVNTIPRTQIWLSREQDRTLFNRAKALIEDYTQLEWDWWPLKPRMRDLNDGETRVIWKCVSHTAS